MQPALRGRVQTLGFSGSSGPPLGFGMEGPCLLLTPQGEVIALASGSGEAVHVSMVTATTCG